MNTVYKYAFLVLSSVVIAGCTASPLAFLSEGSSKSRAPANSTPEPKSDNFRFGFEGLDYALPLPAGFCVEPGYSTGRGNPATVLFSVCGDTTNGGLITMTVSKSAGAALKPRDVVKSAENFGGGDQGRVTATRIRGGIAYVQTERPAGEFVKGFNTTVWHGAFTQGEFDVMTAIYKPYQDTAQSKTAFARIQSFSTDLKKAFKTTK